MEHRPKLLVLCGPTASGKTALGVALAQATGGEVVSADSMQIYRRMDIGTAKPTKEEMGGVTHHMLDVADPAEDYSVARYVHDADACVRDILARGRLPIVVGGTGLYIDNLIAGRDFASFTGAWREKLQARAREEGLPALHEELRRIDPDRAEKLHPNDEKRILRALEVWYETGETITAHDERTRDLPPKYDALRVCLTFSHREDLWDRIDRRVDLMMAAGLEEEVRSLLASGVPPRRHRHAGHRLQGVRRRPPGGGAPGPGRGRGQAPLPAVRQAAAHLVPPHPGHPVGHLGKRPRPVPGPTGSDSIYGRIWYMMGTFQQKEECTYHADQIQPSGHLSHQSPPEQDGGHPFPHERLPAPGDHHRL